MENSMASNIKLTPFKYGYEFAKSGNAFRFPYDDAEANRTFRTGYNSWLAKHEKALTKSLTKSY
jgi:hypothetical protein